jgi:3-oxoacyl-[acyl-carrier protein] reductase
MTWWCIAASARGGEEVANAILELGREARVLCFDVADRGQAAAPLLADIEAHGAYYGVVCNAGIARDGAFPAMTGEEWDAVIHTNLDAFYNVLNPVVMPMVRRRKPGRIVTLSSVSGLVGNRGPDQLQRGQGRHHRRHQGAGAGTGQARTITVNCVAPGPDRHRHG